MEALWIIALPLIALTTILLIIQIFWGKSGIWGGGRHVNSSHLVHSTRHRNGAFMVITLKLSTIILGAGIIVRYPYSRPGYWLIVTYSYSWPRVGLFKYYAIIFGSFSEQLNYISRIIENYHFTLLNLKEDGNFTKHIHLVLTPQRKYWIFFSCR